jgi:hypothetical protein
VAEFRDAAAWSGMNLPEDAVVLNRKPRIFRVLGGTQGRVFPFSRDPEALLAEADALGARYLLVGYPDGVTMTYLPAVVQGRPGAFCVVESWGEATTLLGILPPGERDGPEVTFCPPGYGPDPGRAVGAAREGDGRIPLLAGGVRGHEVPRTPSVLSGLRVSGEDPQGDSEEEEGQEGIVLGVPHLQEDAHHRELRHRGEGTETGEEPPPGGQQVVGHPHQGPPHQGWAREDRVQDGGVEDAPPGSGQELIGHLHRDGIGGVPVPPEEDPGGGQDPRGPGAGRRSPDQPTEGGPTGPDPAFHRRGDGRSGGGGSGSGEEGREKSVVLPGAGEAADRVFHGGPKGGFESGHGSSFEVSEGVASHRV